MEGLIIAGIAVGVLLFRYLYSDSPETTTYKKTTTRAPTAIAPTSALPPPSLVVVHEGPIPASRAGVTPPPPPPLDVGAEPNEEYQGDLLARKLEDAKNRDIEMREPKITGDPGDPLFPKDRNIPLRETGIDSVIEEPLSLRSIAYEIAVANGIDPRYFRAVINAESSWNPSAMRREPRLGKNVASVGLMQILHPTTSAGLMKNYPVLGSLTKTTLLDPVVNMRAGAKLIGENKRILKTGNPKMLYCAYNSGYKRIDGKWYPRSYDLETGWFLNTKQMANFTRAWEEENDA